MKTMNLLAMWRNRRARADVYSKPDYWDSKAEELSGDAVSMWPNNHLNRLYHEEQLGILEELLPEVSERRVLDVGCGTGRISRYLAARGAKVSGFDFSAKAIEIARQCSAGDNPRYCVKSVFELEERHTYDVAVTWGCLTMACRNRAQLLDVLLRIRRALTPGGTLAVLEPIHSGFVHRVLDMHLADFCEVMREGGFEVKDVHQLHFWPTRFALAFVPWPDWFTRFGYGMGQGCMKLPVLRRMGDYKAIRGTVTTSGS
jgi:SAM-dependent methyltransferase